MKVTFWGVRGSVPTPLSSLQIQNKIAAAISRITAKDIESEDAKMKFLASLPPWIFGTVGGNSACVQVQPDSGATFILDMGTGVRVFGKKAEQPKDLHYTVFMSHFHWDHIQGLPFWDQTYYKDARFDVYSAYPEAEKYLEEQSRLPYFPTNGCWQNIKNKFTFHTIQADEPFFVEGVKITAHKMSHPGDSYSFSFEENGRKFIYATDVELTQADFDRSIEINHFFEGADMLVIDSQYTAPEAIQKEHWGHSSFSTVVDFAEYWNAKSVYFFHHEPMYDDHKLYKILQQADWYTEYKKDFKVKVYIALEEQEVIV